MANRQLVDYVLSLQHTTFTQTQIRQTLLEVGWTEKEVDTAFTQAQKETVVPVRSDIRPAAVALAAVVLILIALSPMLGTISSPTGNVIGATSEQQTHVLSEAAPSTEVLVLEEVEQSTPPTIESVPPVPEAPPSPATAPTQVSTPAPAVQASSAECGQLGGSLRDNCFAQEAIAKQDTRACSRIRDLSILTNCVTAIAIQKQQPTLCDTLIFQDECRTAFARETQDFSACQAITQPQKRVLCLTA